MIPEKRLILVGIDLKIYRLMVKRGRPIGIRELQRKLNLSSPSIVQYHLLKLERLGLLKRDSGNYKVNRIILDRFFKLNKFLLPKNLIWTLIAFFTLLFDLTFLNSNYLSITYVIGTLSEVVLLLILLRETWKVWNSDSL
jgi:DNA-binding Lrp family transcriptional regulator